MIPVWMLAVAGAAAVVAIVAGKKETEGAHESGTPPEDEHATTNTGPKKCACGSFAAADGFCKKCRPADES